MTEMTDDERRPFLAAIREMPDDDVRRLVYADRLDDSGDPADADHAWLIRRMIANRDHHIIVDQRPGMKATHCSGRLQFRRCGAFMRRLGRKFGDPVFCLWRRGFPKIIRATWKWWQVHGERCLLWAVKPTVHIADRPDVRGFIRAETMVAAREMLNGDGLPGPLTLEQALGKIYPEAYFTIPSEFVWQIGEGFTRRVRGHIERELHLPVNLPAEPLDLRAHRMVRPVRVTQELLVGSDLDIGQLIANRSVNLSHAFRVDDGGRTEPVGQPQVVTPEPTRAGTDEEAE